MNLIICGSRTITDRALVFNILDQFYHENPTITGVFSGRAKGVDEIGEAWAESRGIPLFLYAAEWTKNGKLNRGAGFERNKRMVDTLGEGGQVVALWDGHSKGTRHTIGYARKQGVQVHVFEVIKGAIRT